MGPEYVPLPPLKGSEVLGPLLSIGYVNGI